MKINLHVTGFCKNFYCRIVERGYYSERDAADVLRQICDALNVSPLIYRIAFFQKISILPHTEGVFGLAFKSCLVKETGKFSEKKKLHENHSILAKMAATRMFWLLN